LPIFEDFDGAQQWGQFEAQMRACAARCRFRQAGSVRIASSIRFFRIENIDAIVHPMSHIAPSYYGLFEDNDPSKRLMVIANFDNDVPEYWEWSGRAFSVRRHERRVQARRQLSDLRLTH